MWTTASEKVLSTLKYIKYSSYLGNTEAATRAVLWKKVFLKISQNSQENSFVRVSFLIKLQA